MDKSSFYPGLLLLSINTKFTRREEEGNVEKIQVFMSIKIIYSFHFCHATSLQKRHASSLKLWVFGGIFCIKFKYIDGSISSTSKSDHLNFWLFIGDNNGNIGHFFVIYIQCNVTTLNSLFYGNIIIVMAIYQGQITIIPVMEALFCLMVKEYKFKVRSFFQILFCIFWQFLKNFCTLFP